LRVPAVGALRFRQPGGIIITEPAHASVGDARGFHRFDQWLARVFADLVGPEVPWNRTTLITFTSLIILWAVLMSMTWGTWGTLQVDCGREMYVSAVLSEGKMLYRDVSYEYSPAAPYLNSFLFRLFGIHLNVLYWAGSLCALGSAIFLFLAGMRLGSWVIGWAVAALTVIQAFPPWLFSFPLPYSYGSVYGCFTACVFIWLIVRGCASKHWAWIFGAGTAAALALLFKIEYGIACYGTLVLWILARGFQQRSWKSIPKDLVAVLPGLLLCLAVARWMISIAGVEFITNENLWSWPTSYGMKTYGKVRLADTGFIITPLAFVHASIRAAVLVVFLLGLYALLRRARTARTSVFLVVEVAAVVCALLVPYLPNLAAALFHWIFFPQDMVLFVSVAGLFAWWSFVRSPGDSNPAIALLLAFSALLAFRMLMGIQPTGFPVFYDQPVVLCFLLLVSRLILPHSRRSSLAFLRQAEVLVCFGCLLVAGFDSNPFRALAQTLTPLVTERGTVRTSPRVAEGYQAAIKFMKEKAAAGEYVLSVPEDTSLYFLSGTHCPTRVIEFYPGMLAPGKMTEETIREIERTPTPYILWSNDNFEVHEFGVSSFGDDYDRTLGDYIRSHYRPQRALLPDSGPDWNAVIWERVPEPGPSQ
jgi:hypothetical protein